jgi:hypothetical protein
MRYRSSLTLLGFPLIDVALGAPGTSGRGVARGWIAIGDVAIGAVAFGGVALGGLSLGGVALGALAIAGAAGGVWSVGGVAIGAFGFGGLAVALVAATGGLAVAGEYAVGGLAVAVHANDEAARAYFASGRFFHYAHSLTPYLRWILAALVGVAALIWALGSRRDRSA